jgi:hypothetical protein
VTDAAYGFYRVTLLRNIGYQGEPIWLDKLHFKFFENIGNLEKSSDTLSLVIPPIKNEHLQLSNRFSPYQYSTYEFFGIFFHTDRLSSTLRNALHWQIGTSLSGTLVTDHRAIDNIFQGEEKILPHGLLGNFSDILRKNGYTKKDELLANIEKTPTTWTGTIPY